MIPNEHNKENVEKRLNEIDEENQYWDTDFLGNMEEYDEQESEEEENDYICQSRLSYEYEPER